jgi:hypothetical protein
MIGDYVPRSKVDLNERVVDEDDLSDLSDAELRRMAKAIKADDGSTDDTVELKQERPDGRSARSEGDGETPDGDALEQIDASPQSARAGDDGPTAQQSCAKLGLGSSSGTARSEGEEVEDA